jgi:TPR repeat protein
VDAVRVEAYMVSVIHYHSESDPMRRFASLILMTAASLTAVPALAQGNQFERTQAEIVVEQATENLARDRAGRADAIRDCATKDYAACTRLGDYYRKGWGGVQDYTAAAKAYRKACTGKDAVGCATLGYLATKGYGMEQDLTEARRLYKVSCDLGEVSGCAGYGNMVFAGQGGPKNVAEGTRVLQSACDTGYKWACDRITGLAAYDPNDDTWERLKDGAGR